MVHAPVPLPDLAEMFRRLGEAPDFPADLAHVAGAVKAAFSARFRLSSGAFRSEEDFATHGVAAALGYFLPLGIDRRRELIHLVEEQFAA